MGVRLTKSSLIVVVSLFLLAVAACTPGYINTEDLGTRATAEQIRAHYSGNSVRYANEFGGKVNIEAYFAADGTYKAVFLDRPQVALGTWIVHTALGRNTLNIEARDYFLADGKVIGSSFKVGAVVYIQPDGTAKLDQMGGGNFTQPKPTRGFPSEARWNSLRRQAGF